MEDFETIYARYYPEIYRFVLSLSRDPFLAEDIAQETFLRAIRAIGSFNGACGLSTWLCQIAKNLYFSHVRKHKRLRALLPGDMTGKSDSAEIVFMQGDQARTMHEALHLLKEPYKEVFMLRVFAELNFAQISALFGKGESWARVTFYRAKVMLRNQDKEE